MPKKTVSQYEADLVQLEADIRHTANMVIIDGDLTPEGRVNRHQNWSKERKWNEKFEAAATGLTSALESAQTKAATVRQSLTAMPSGEAALAAEMRMQRRMKRLDAALSSDGIGAVTQLILDADDTELAVMVEHVADHYESVGGHWAKAGREIVEDALRQRSPAYDEAARVAGAAGNGLTVAREKLDYVGRLIADPATPVPSEHSIARMSVAEIGGDGVGDLAA